MRHCIAVAQAGRSDYIRPFLHTPDRAFHSSSTLVLDCIGSTAMVGNVSVESEKQQLSLSSRSLFFSLHFSHVTQLSIFHPHHQCMGAPRNATHCPCPVCSVLFQRPGFRYSRHETLDLYRIDWSCTYDACGCADGNGLQVQLHVWRTRAAQELHDSESRNDLMSWIMAWSYSWICETQHRRRQRDVIRKGT